MPDSEAAEDGREDCLTIQPAPENDSLGARLPYPYHVFVADGVVGRQDFWKGNPASVVGFAKRAGRCAVDLTFTAWKNEPSKAVGMFCVFADASGDFTADVRPIASVQPNRAKRVPST